ncbi:MAG: acylneuraminate cytidylyltransferase [Candidatus Omnitrophota bacterium]|nr:acylneuraminate cytidylyltransferase [Candidatus Omnitrophota bacterium]
MGTGNDARENLGIILQARMGSSRLPGKILKKIGNKPLLGHIFFRLAFLKHQAMVVLATTSSPKDDVVERYCRSKNIHCFRGNEENVLERYYFCAKEYGFGSIIRLTADNPFLDIEELDNLIELYYRNGLDYASSCRSLPVGAGAEIFTFDALEKSYFNGKAAHHLEHVDEYIMENIKQFHTDSLKVNGDKNRPDIRLTVDTEADYETACFIVNNALDEYITTQDAIRLISDFAA